MTLRDDEMRVGRTTKKTLKHQKTAANKPWLNTVDDAELYLCSLFCVMSDHFLHLKVSLLREGTLRRPKRKMKMNELK